MSRLLPHELGDYLREQREAAQLSMRQLADRAGISNPYLSQIERGLKKPSAEILSQLARGLSVSVESLYVRAGLLDIPHGEDTAASAPCSVPRAIAGDPALTPAQRDVLLAVYGQFTDSPDPASDRSLEKSPSKSGRRTGSTRPVGRPEPDGAQPARS